MSPAHRHVEAGGDPAQGPADDLANRPPGPGAGNDFPDVPEANTPGRGAAGRSAPTPDQPDLDRFAERLGLSDDSVRSDEEAQSRTSSTGWRGRVGRVLATGAGTTADVLRSAAGWLDRRSARTRDDS